MARYLYIWVRAYIDFQWPHFLNGCLVAILDFSVSGLHGFSSVTQICFGISVSNFMCMSLVAVGRSLTIVSYVLLSTHCPLPPLLWGGGILVDHWSAISSYVLIWVLPSRSSKSYDQDPFHFRLSRVIFSRRIDKWLKSISTIKGFRYVIVKVLLVNWIKVLIVNGH